MLQFKSIGQRIAAFVIAILLVVCAGLGIISYTRSSGAVVNEVERSLVQLAEECAAKIESELERKLDVFRVLANLEVICSPETELEEKLSVLRREAQRNDSLNIAFSYSNGAAITVDYVEMQIGDREYFQKAMQGEANMSDPIISREDGTMVMVNIAPVYYGSRITGAVFGTNDAAFLTDFTDQMGFGERGYAFITNSTGLLIAHENRDFIYDQVDFREMAKTDPDYEELARLIDKMVAGEKGVESYYFQGEKRYMAYQPIGNTGWSLAVGSFENEILAGVRQLRNVIMAVSLGALVLGVLLALWLGRAISSPIKDASTFADNMSYGDFSNELPSSVLNMKDEIGILARSFDRMQKSLREMLSKVKAGSVKVHQSSESLAASSEEMSASLEEVASSANEFSSGASNLSEGANEMHKMGIQISERAQDGYGAVEKAVSQMGDISENVANLKENVSSLNAQVENIGSIVGTIKGIAEQTNLLALNAAIEAARAGEQGRGFAVVAEEVRKLAEQSASSAEEITKIITSIQYESRNVAEQMSESVKSVENGTEAVFYAGDILKQIIDQIQGIVGRIEQVASVAQEIGAGSEEVSAAVEEQTATMNEIANSASDLQGLVDELNNAIAAFKF